MVATGWFMGDTQEMAITGELLKFQIRYEWGGQRCENVMWYFPGGAAFLTATAAAVAEAYWNNIKDLFLAMIPDDPTPVMSSILCTEYLGGSGYGEYAIPSGERVGTRVGMTGDFVSGIMAVGMRLTVATRTTRPGQKRFPFLYESDIAGNALGVDILAAVEDAAEIFDTVRLLGAPVALGSLTPVVVTFNSAPGVTEDEPQAYQDVIGHLINADITSQVSRKKGRGI